MNEAGIQIGDLAKRAGVTVDTVRFYERRKLLPSASRTGGGFRLFAPELVERIRFIKQAQELGFSLDEIKGLLATGGAEECRRVRDLLKTKIDDLDAKVKAMKNFRITLTKHLSACERELGAHGDDACCPVVITSKKKTAK